MNSFETKFARDLKSKVEETAQRRLNALSQGYAQDFPAYKESVGYLKALGDTLKMMDEVYEAMKENERK